MSFQPNSSMIEKQKEQYTSFKNHRISIANKQITYEEQIQNASKFKYHYL